MAARRRRYRLTRDGVLFGLGIAGIINEEFIRAGAERPSLLVLLGGLVGLPAILRADEVRRRLMQERDAERAEGPATRRETDVR